MTIGEETFADAVIALAEASGIDVRHGWQTRVANLIGIAPTHFNRLLRGHQPPSAGLMARVAQATAAASPSSSVTLAKRVLRAVVDGDETEVLRLAPRLAMLVVEGEGQ